MRAATSQRLQSSNLIPNPCNEPVSLEERTRREFEVEQMNRWDQWVGREQRLSDWFNPRLATQFCATLDRVVCSDGTAPHGCHWCLCPPADATSRLGLDGHPRRDETESSFLPPVPLERRMWASSNVEFVRPLRPAESIDRLSRILSITEKHGASGALTFIDVAHDTIGNGSLAVREVQTVVYRGPASSEAATIKASSGRLGFDPGDWDLHKIIEPTEALLFRYSALTFNSHRIHYDFPYATRVEGYRGLVAQGPLIATMLLQLTAEKFGDNALKTFKFRGTSPAICNEALHLVVKGQHLDITMGAYTSEGREVMRATGHI